MLKQHHIVAVIAC